LAKVGSKPSYIPAQTFVLALMDTIKDPANEGSPIALARESVDGLPDGELKRALLALVSDAEGSADQVRKNLETWFDHAMDRASGWYKRKAKIFMFLIALGLAAGMNVDSIHVASSLWKDQGLRQAIIAQAVAFNASGLSASNAQKTYGELKLELDKVKNLSLPIGWRNGAFNLLDKQSCLLALIGWLMTALCVSLGAPFWFDALGKALSIRAAGRRPKKSADTE